MDMGIVDIFSCGISFWFITRNNECKKDGDLFCVSTDNGIMKENKWVLDFFAPIYIRPLASFLLKLTQFKVWLGLCLGLYMVLLNFYYIFKSNGRNLVTSSKIIYCFDTFLKLSFQIQKLGMKAIC